MNAKTLLAFLQVDRVYPGVLPHLISVYKIGKTDGKLEYADKEIKELRKELQWNSTNA